MPRVALPFCGHSISRLSTSQFVALDFHTGSTRGRADLWRRSGVDVWIRARQDPDGRFSHPLSLQLAGISGPNLSFGLTVCPPRPKSCCVSSSVCCAPPATRLDVREHCKPKRQRNYMTWVPTSRSTLTNCHWRCRHNPNLWHEFCNTQITLLVSCAESIMFFFFV